MKEIKQMKTTGELKIELKWNENDGVSCHTFPLNPDAVHDALKYPHLS